MLWAQSLGVALGGVAGERTGYRRGWDAASTRNPGSLGTMCVCPSREGKFCSSVLISEDFVFVLLGWGMEGGISVCLSSLMFYLSAPVEGLGGSSLLWACPSGQSI